MFIKKINFKKYILSILALLVVIQACEKSEKKEEKKLMIKKDSLGIKSFFASVNGKEVNLYTLRNKNGIKVKITNYGGIITSILAPDKNGKFEDIVLGYDSLSGYLNKETPYFGALIGRYGNRIANGKFMLDGNAYSLAINNGPNHLHGGLKGFDKVVWQAQDFKTDSTEGLQLFYTSKDMEEGYPGNLKVNVKYTLQADNSLKIDYEATTDKNTVINLTNHSYFNLCGDAKKDISGHQISIRSNEFIPVDNTLIPIGTLKKVEGTPFDFRKPTAINVHIDDNDEQIKFGGGFDHCWVLDKKENILSLAATVYEPESGRKMEVFTTEPGVQFYTGNFLDGKLKGKHGVMYKKRFGLCLETEHFPDSPNQPSFPSVVLKKGNVYNTSTIFKFSN